MQFIWKTCCLFKMKAANIYCFKFLLEQNIKMLVRRNNDCRKQRTCLLSVTLNINTSAVIRKIAKEAVSPSLSSFEGHFAAQRQTPNTLPEHGAHPLSQRAGSAADRREKSEK